MAHREEGRCIDWSADGGGECRRDVRVECSGALVVVARVQAPQNSDDNPSPRSALYETTSVI
ncbi:hypothetical protein B0H10DRAFT_4303 [Mycena sp. CBHHK59/15]|nr:hypothetical protein B0H10DRAFT_4303 [Mycena sp. CBHHK59/15]